MPDLNVNVDCFLHKATTHDICEDYVMVGTEPFPYMILSDGCSTANRTDVGSRILCYSAFAKLKEFYKDFSIKVPSSQGFSNIIAATALISTENIIPMDCLDATLIIAFVDANGKLKVFLYGDGCFLYKIKGDPLLYVEEVKFTHNAPYYISYTLNDKRLSEYAKASEKESVVITKYSISPEGEVQVLKDYKMAVLERLLYEYELSEYELFGISSDGISGIIQGNDVFKTTTMATEFFDYKVMAGNFVKRQMKYLFDRKFPKEKIYPYDDISLAVLHNLA